MGPLHVIAVWFVLCVGCFRVCFGVTTQMSASPSFVVEPDNTPIILEHGETRTIDFHCKVSNLQPGQKVSWLKGFADTIISDDYIVRTEHVRHLVDNYRYFVVGNETSGEYNLRIAMVSYQTAAFDSGRYQCATFPIDPPISFAVVRSRPASVYIYIVPRVIYPNCFVNNVNPALAIDVFEGESVTLLCESDAGYPTVSLAWHHGNTSSILYNNVSVRNDIASVEYKWVPTESDVSVTFTCSIDYPALLWHERSRTRCSVGPFNIHRRTTTRHPPSSTHKYVSEKKPSPHTVSDSDNDPFQATTLTTSSSETSAHQNHQCPLCGQNCSASLLVGISVRGLLLGVIITVISGRIYISLSKRHVEKPEVRISTVVANTNSLQMEDAASYYNVGNYDDVTERTTQDKQYQNLTDSQQNHVYCTLEKEPE